MNSTGNKFVIGSRAGRVRLDDLCCFATRPRLMGSDR